MEFVFLAGIGNSEPDHWQSIWFREKGVGGHWVEHVDWNEPNCARWVSDLQQCLSTCPGPKVMVAHSLGCLALAEWSKVHRDPSIVGAFMVAVPDVQGPCFPQSASGFAGEWPSPLPFPTWVITSRDDAYACLDHARSIAQKWGARLVDVGVKGHINCKSNLGGWPEGFALLSDFVSQLNRPEA